MSTAFDTETLTRILSLQENEVRDFVRNAIVHKNLSAIMRDLNAELLDGTPDTRAQAAQAIARLGFSPDA